MLTIDCDYDWLIEWLITRENESRPSQEFRFHFEKILFRRLFFESRAQLNPGNGTHTLCFSVFRLDTIWPTDIWTKCIWETDIWPTRLVNTAIDRVILSTINWSTLRLFIQPICRSCGCRSYGILLRDVGLSFLPGFSQMRGKDMTNITIRFTTETSDLFETL